MTTVVLAEKPSVARDLAAVLGASARRDGWLEGSGFRVTWAIGHLVGLAQPHEICDAWRRWDAALLPMLPDTFPLVVRERLAKQYAVVKKLFNARDTREIVCATDAGREGELIFRLIYEAAECTKPVRRLWVSSLTADAIREGFRTLKPGAAYDALGAAARARSEADWLVGMNLSRAYSLASGDRLNVGRVKTPTLAMVVARDLAIQGFRPVPYREVEVTFGAEGGELKAKYVRADYDAKGEPILTPRLPPASAAGSAPLEPRVCADRVAARARVGRANVVRVEEEKSAIPPPLLFDLTELQRTCNRAWGWTATHTLEVAQRLYEQHKVLSYPRTDSRHLSEAVAAELPAVVAAVRPTYEDVLSADVGRAKLRRRFVDDSKVSDHHAIIPTATPPRNLIPGSDEAQLYDLVCRRLLSAWLPDAVDSTTRVDLLIRDGESEDRYEARGKSVVVRGWRALDGAVQRGDKEVLLPSGLRGGMTVAVRDARVLQKETRPPEFFTEATLLSAMESAGASLDGELSAAMKERGLGTPATRATMLEELVEKGYLERAGKTLRATELGIALIRRVHAHVASPAMTGEWEAQLRAIEKGQASARDLMGRVRTFVAQTTAEALSQGVAPRKQGSGDGASASQNAGRGPRQDKARPGAVLGWRSGVLGCRR